MRDRNLAIAETVRAEAARLGRSSSSVAIRWLMERGVIPFLGARNALQLQDLLTATQFTLNAAATAALDAAGQIDLGYPRSSLEGPMGPRMLHGDRVGEIVGR